MYKRFHYDFYVVFNIMYFFIVCVSVCVCVLYWLDYLWMDKHCQ